MSFAGFDEIVKLETELGPDLLVDVMLGPQPGWIDTRSWEFWRGRLMGATGRMIPLGSANTIVSARCLCLGWVGIGEAVVGPGLPRSCCQRC
jgi:hypothetical protein